MEATFIIYEIEAYTFKSKIVFECNSAKEADEEYTRLNSTLNAESLVSYRLIVKYIK